MYNIAKASDNERMVLFRNTAEKMGISEGIVEKDFWVTLILDYLFHKSRWKEHFAFKGGTSLSKSYNLIERFSEDIDLILDWRVIGFGINEPWADRSKTKQQEFNVQAHTKAVKFIKEAFIPDLKKDLASILERKLNVAIDANDPQTVSFEYPCLFSEAYILKTIRLEIGALAAWTPVEPRVITSYSAQQYARAFQQLTTEILTTSAERSFWEKVTILHHEAHRPEGSPMPKRYSRHYYDLFCICNSQYKEKAYQNLELLDKVVKFKQKFYPRGWAKYEDAKPGTIRLIPANNHISELKSDYTNMRNMIYGYYPSFDELMKSIQKLEVEINNLSK